VGTLLWMAPEMLDPHTEGAAPPPGASGATADVHSFGVLLWELLARRLPWDVAGARVSRAEVLRVVVKERRRLPLPAWAHPDLAALIAACWAPDARQRPSMAQVTARLEALPSWDTDGRLARGWVGDAAPQTAPVRGLPSVAVADAVRAAAALRGSPAAASAPPPLLAEAEEALTRSEVEPQRDAPPLPPPVMPAPARSRPASKAAPADALAAALGAALGGRSSAESAEALLSAVLPHAYASEVGPARSAELDGLVTAMKTAAARSAQLEERRGFDPLAAVVAEGKKAELEALAERVTLMRAEAAVKAWERVAAIMAAADVAASAEYARARELLAESQRRALETGKGGKPVRQ